MAVSLCCDGYGRPHKALPAASTPAVSDLVGPDAWRELLRVTQSVHACAHRDTGTRHQSESALQWRFLGALYPFYSRLCCVFKSARYSARKPSLRPLTDRHDSPSVQLRPRGHCLLLTHTQVSPQPGCPGAAWPGTPTETHCPGDPRRGCRAGRPGWASPRGPVPTFLQAEPHVTTPNSHILCLP